jgi:hypothetical protein
VKPEVQSILDEAALVAHALDAVVAHMPWHRRIPARFGIWRMRALDRLWWLARGLGLIRDRPMTRDQIIWIQHVIREAEADLERYGKQP